MKRFLSLSALIMLVLIFSGCATLDKARLADKLSEENRRLKLMLKDAESKEEEISDLERAKRELARKLEKEIGEYKAKLEMTERGLVITFLAEVFFDSGKDEIKKQGESTLKEVASVLNEDVPDSYVAIEGHTDSDPIKYSNWKSNWELSSARALSVLHYFIDSCSVEPSRLSANGYGEYRPVAPNDTPKGKQQNRRVEIVILPSSIKKVKGEF